jgi:hypothetical protein
MFYALSLNDKIDSDQDNDDASGFLENPVGLVKAFGFDQSFGGAHGRPGDQYEQRMSQSVDEQQETPVNDIPFVGD